MKGVWVDFGFVRTLSASLSELEVYESRLETQNVWQDLATCLASTKVEELDICNCSIAPDFVEATLPSELGFLSGLKRLWLVNCELGGTIPLHIGGLTQLRNLNLQENELYGSIPDSMGDLVHLIRLCLGCNQLTGQIPTTLGRLTRLDTLFLNDNDLDGSIPSELCTMSCLRHLDLSNNYLDSFPSEVFSLCGLTTLVLHGNGFSDVYYPSQVHTIRHTGGRRDTSSFGRF